MENSITNKQGITQIELSFNIQAYCPMGSEYYTNNVYVTFFPHSIIPDYCELDKFVRSLSGKELIIEDVVAAIYDKIWKECEPYTLKVSSTVTDAVHMPVTVTKDSESIKHRERKDIVG